MWPTQRGGGGDSSGPRGEVGTSSDPVVLDIVDLSPLPMKPGIELLAYYAGAVFGFHHCLMLFDRAYPNIAHPPERDIFGGMRVHGPLYIPVQ